MFQESKCFASTKKSLFLLKNIYIYNLWYLAALETLNIHGGFILASIFPEDMIYTETLLVPFLCILSKECFIFNKNWLHAIENHFCQCHWSSAEKEALLCSTFLELLTRFYLARSCLVQLVTACYGSSRFLWAMASHNIVACKFTINQLYVKYY